MQLRQNRAIEREAVNAARAFFERCNCVFQEIDGSNDYGKDAYVDLVEGNKVTGLCIALQIKGGKSYRRADGYGIPLDKAHADLWGNSTLPVMGIVYEPDDAQLRWCNISEFLAAHSDKLPSYIPVEKHAILTPHSLENEFRSSVERTRLPELDHPVLCLSSPSEDVKLYALYECFGLGRSDARILIAVRYIMRMLKDEPLRLAIHLLSYVTPHPDILRHEGNWMPSQVRDTLQSHLQWSEDELFGMIEVVEEGEWQRAELVEDLYMLLLEDPQIESKIERLITRGIEAGNFRVTMIAFCLTINWAGEDALAKYQQVTLANPQLLNFDETREIESVLQEHGYMSMLD